MLCYVVYSLPIHKICALCGIFSAISVLLTTEYSYDLEIRVPDGLRSLKVTPVNSSCVISYQSLTVHEAVFCTFYEIPVQPSIGLQSLYFATLLAFNAPDIDRYRIQNRKSDIEASLMQNYKPDVYILSCVVRVIIRIFRRRNRGVVGYLTYFVYFYRTLFQFRLSEYDGSQLFLYMYFHIVSITSYCTPHR